MKKLILNISIGIFCSVNAYCQIGILTQNPATNALVHMDPKSNNASGGVGLNLDDVVVDNNGNVGLGTITPQTKLHIVTGGTSATPNPQVRIEDGYQGTNKVMMTDDNGVAKWSDYVPGYKAGIVGAGIIHSTTAGWSKTNMDISLDPGQWLIFYTISMTANSVSGQPTNYRFWIQVFMGDNTGNATTDALSPNRFSNNGFMDKRAIINGWVAVDNKTLAPKVYSLYAGGVQRSLAGLNLLNVGEASDGYSSIYAFRIKTQ